ncbi:MAG: TonB-dependent receptor [Muribaculaceae bacterium]|nr:TonB-dependent receptor [Muribaculaceae bacterium]
MEKRILTFLLVVACSVMGLHARAVKGTVVDQVNEPVIGANVLVNGTVMAVTDFDGNFEIANVPDGATLKFTFMGMKAVEMKATDVMNVQMEDDVRNLDEVVVIGYGSAQAKDLTAPISVVKGEQLLATPAASPMAAMQGKVSGVNVVNSGTPGEGPKVTIRGNGSFTGGSPLYVVDGMFYDNIDFLNANDIADMSVLKDASAAAIYGVRAANGVVLITTKHGNKNQAAKITYNGYVGFQKATNVLPMASSSEYATMLLEANYDAYVSLMKASIDRYGGSYADSDFHKWTYGSNTDWYKELLRTALITDHSLSITGGGEKATYSLGINYLHQDGVMDVSNYYKRLNFRAAVDYEATNWLKVGFNGIFSKGTQRTPNNAAWQQAFNAPGIYPVFDEKNSNYPNHYASPESVGFTNNFYNPVATANYHNSKNDVNKYLTNFYAQINFIPSKLFFRTSYAYDFSQVSNRTYTPEYYVSTTQHNDKSSVSKSEATYKNWIWDNVLTYKDSFGNHNLGVMLGHSLREDRYHYLYGIGYGIVDGDEAYQYISSSQESDSRRASDGGTRYRSNSYFGRINYDYLGKYLLMFTFRADGTSKYQETWGYYPSIGAAWVMSKENFMLDQNAIDYLKLRASWGRLGNNAVPASDGFRSVTTGNGSSAVFGNSLIAGFQNNSYFTNLKWEVVDETNVGFELATLHNRLSVDVDWFYRMTRKAVIAPRLPFENGTLLQNIGKILNTGVDVSINWADRIGDNFKYNIGANLSYIHNEVKSLAGNPYIAGGKTYQFVGEKMNSFYGYKVEGIYQTAEEIAADPTAVANGLKPGDFKYKDLNGDKIVDGNDRTTLGSYLPNFIYSFNLGFQWKNLDFMLTTYGNAGGKMYNRKRALRYAASNYNFDRDQVTNRWTGVGTSNTYPSAEGWIRTWNVSDQRVNDFFVESANFFRIQNVTLGYTFRNIKMGNYTLPAVRLSATADRPLTLFSANAFTPELSDAEGWDTEVYPLTATYTFGVTIDF